MIKSLQLENFRSYSKLELQDLGRVNLIFGKNNSGKTAILEALLLAALPSQVGNVARRLNESRSDPMGGSNRSLEDLFGGLFHNWNYENTIKIYWIRTEENQNLLGWSRQLSIFTNLGSQSLLPFIDSTDAVSLNFQIESVEMEVSTEAKDFGYSFFFEDLTSPSRIGRDKATRGTDVSIVYLVARGIRDMNGEAQRFSILQVDNKHQEVENALRIIEPRLKKLVVIAQERGSSLYGDLGVGRLIPLWQMGDGMLRILSIALSLSQSQNGIVLIDEVENGLHFSVQEDVWRLIFRTARRLNVQVFVTTHSDECLAAATRAAYAEDAFEELRGIRIDRHESEVSAAIYEGKDLGFALTNGFEVRG